MGLAIVPIRSTKHPPETQCNKNINNNTNNNNNAFVSKMFSVINAGGGGWVGGDQDTHKRGISPSQVDQNLCLQ